MLTRCVAGPSGTGSDGEGFGGAGVVAEHSGDDSGGCFEQELADRGGAGVEAGQPEVAQSQAQGGGVHWLPGAASGKQVTAVGVVGGEHVGAVVDVVEEHFSEGKWHRDRRVAEPEQDLVVLSQYVVDGQLRNLYQWLRVEKDQQREDPVGGGNGVVG